MGSDTSSLVSKLEEGLRNNNLDRQLQPLSEEILKGRDPETASKLLDEVLTEANKKGLMPAMAKAFATANFNDLDRNRDGYIGTKELDEFANAKLLAAATSPLEKGILRYMQSNVKTIAAAHNDITGGSGRLSLKDLAAFENQSGQSFGKAVTGQRMKDAFGSDALFRKLGPDAKGLVSEAQLKANLGSAKFTPDEKQVLQFMINNRKEISKMSDDERFFESKISSKDISKFAEKYSVPVLPGRLSATQDFNPPKAAAIDTTKNHLPEVMLDFGKQHHSTLDADGNGYVSREEIRRLLDSTKLANSLGEGAAYVLSGMDSKLEQIGNSSRDERWYKDTKGISLQDLDKYAENQRKNRSEIPTTPGDHNLSLTIGGVNRDYTVHIPPGYDGKAKLPVMYFFHYFTGDPKNAADYSGMSAKADKENFIVVYPKAEGWIDGKIRQWNLNNKPSYRVDEVAFVEQLMNKVDEKLSVDKSREYVVGYSNGGMIAHEVAAKFSDRIAGMVSVSGCQNGSEKRPSSPVPVMMINGTEDWLVPYNGRRFTPLFPRMKPVSDSVDFWKKTNGTDGYRSEEMTPNVRREVYGKNNSEVVLVTMKGSGHGWPGSDTSIDGNLCREINGSQVVWDFLKDKQRSGKNSPLPPFHSPVGPHDFIANYRPTIAFRR